MLLDTSALIEHYRGTEKGIHIKKLALGRNIFINPLSIAEFVQWADKFHVSAPAGLELLLSFQHIELSIALLGQAGINYNLLRPFKKKISLIDSIIYTSALMHDLELITTDSDFEGLPGVVLIR